MLLRSKRYLRTVYPSTHRTSQLKNQSSLHVVLMSQLNEQTYSVRFITRTYIIQSILVVDAMLIMVLPPLLKRWRYHWRSTYVDSFYYRTSSTSQHLQVRLNCVSGLGMVYCPCVPDMALKHDYKKLSDLDIPQITCEFTQIGEEITCFTEFVGNAFTVRQRTCNVDR